MAIEEGIYKNFAFISYNHRDMVVAKWLQKHLEAFKLPTYIPNEINNKNRYLRPIFRDQSDLNTGILSEELIKKLEESKFLILICSKNSANSKWVSSEARTFVEMGRINRIIPVIIQDKGESENDLFPEYLREYFVKHPDKELLGINYRESGKERSLIKVVSKMLDVSFDKLWQRHVRQKRLRIFYFSSTIILAVIMIYLFAIPWNLKIKVKPENLNLPIEDNISMRLNDALYLTPTKNPDFDLISLPGYHRFRNIPIQLSSQFYTAIDTVIKGDIGLGKVVDIILKRDHTFEIFAGHVMDGELKPVQNATIKVKGQETLTGENGYFILHLPLEEQKSEQKIEIYKPGYETIVREDEVPGSNLTFILRKQQ